MCRKDPLPGYGDLLLIYLHPANNFLPAPVRPIYLQVMYCSWKRLFFLFWSNPTPERLLTMSNALLLLRSSLWLSCFGVVDCALCHFFRTCLGFTDRRFIPGRSFFFAKTKNGVSPWFGRVWFRFRSRVAVCRLLAGGVPFTFGLCCGYSVMYVLVTLFRFEHPGMACSGNPIFSPPSSLPYV